MVVEEEAAGLRIADQGGHRGRVSPRDGARLAHLAVLAHPRHEAHLVAARALDLPPHQLGGGGGEEEVHGGAAGVHPVSGGGLGRGQPTARAGSASASASRSAASSSRLHGVQVEEVRRAPAPRLVLRAAEAGGVDPQLRGGGVAVLDLHQPAAPPLVLEDRAVFRHALEYLSGALAFPVHTPKLSRRRDGGQAAVSGTAKRARPGGRARFGSRGGGEPTTRGGAAGRLPHAPRRARGAGRPPRSRSRPPRACWRHDLLARHRCASLRRPPLRRGGPGSPPRRCARLPLRPEAGRRSTTTSS